MTARKQRCGNCRWWASEPSIATASRLPDGSADDIGSCHLDGPPQIVRVGEGWVSLFPAVRAHRFCSEWTMPTGDGDPDDGERASADIIPMRSAA